MEQDTAAPILIRLGFVFPRLSTGFLVMTFRGDTSGVAAKKNKGIV